jgi:hypothetical protein
MPQGSDKMGRALRAAAIGRDPTIQDPRRHPSGSQLGAQDDPVNVDTEDPLGDGVGLVDRAAGCDDAGIVHQHVDRSELVFNMVEKILKTQLAARVLDGRSVDIADRGRGAQIL